MNRFELLPDEKILLDNPKHWRNYILPVATLCLAFAGLWFRLAHPEKNLVNMLSPGFLPAGVVQVMSYVEAMTMLIIIMAVGLDMVNTAYTRYYVTNKRIIAISGWFRVRVSEMLLDRCESVSLSQKVSERIFNSGDILCVSAGASIYLDDVYDARRFRQTIVAELTKRFESMR